ncbi:MAG: hypothetical protein ACRD50_05870 [Candidatus Acidiferrales bacterium]
MSKEVRRALGALSVSIEKNLPRINRKLSMAGVSPNPLVLSAAKYYAALNKLAGK